jgi:arylformamidase
MAAWKDISRPLDENLPLWPSARPWRLAGERDGRGVRSSRLEMDVHSGTHMDAPAHACEAAAGIESLPPELLAGPCHVAPLAHGGAIGADTLEAAGVPPGVERLLLKTPNSRLWHEHGPHFQADYAALNEEGARWIAERGIRLVGIDYLSIQRFDEEGFSTHHILFDAGVAILEGLDLTEASAGPGELVALPLLLVGADGAPARALLKQGGDGP